MKTPILIIMFTRSSTLKRVFEQVRLAKPERLFLYQDGPRETNYEKDLEGIKKCREIVSNVDWECSVTTWYQSENIGCDPGSFYAYKWFFEQVEQGIILEDDVVPSHSFFTYCEELLDKYSHNDRIYRICGVNHEGISKVKTSYFFSRKGATGSWASWKRVANMWDPSYSFLDNPGTIASLKEKFESEDYFSSWIQTAFTHREAGVPYYETILYENKIINNMLDIIPARNLVTNIGLTEDAVHTKNYNIMPRAMKKCFNAKRYDLEFPLEHPDDITENYHYTDYVNKIMGWGHPLLRRYRKWETRVKRLLFGDKVERRLLIEKLFTSRGD